MTIMFYRIVPVESVNNFMTKFEQYLEEYLMDKFPQTLDDDMSDMVADYEWDTNELIELGDNFAKLRFIDGKQEGLEVAKMILTEQQEQNRK